MGFFAEKTIGDGTEIMVVSDEQSFDTRLCMASLTVKGSASFWENVDSDNLGIEGDAEFNGLATCDNLSCEGTALMKKKLICENAIVAGSLECYENVNTDILSVTGQMKVAGKISAINANISGKLSVNRKFSADKINVTGSIFSKSKVLALLFKLDYKGKPSNLIKLDAELVEVGCKNSKVMFDDYALVCDTITCHTAKLENAKVNYIFCESCKIGKGCKIRRIECRNAPVIEDGAIVEEIKYF